MAMLYIRTIQKFHTFVLTQIGRSLPQSGGGDDSGEEEKHVCIETTCVEKEGPLLHALSLST